MKLRLGEYLLDPLAHRLERRGRSLLLQPVQLDLLLYLVLHRERVVSRDEIFDRVWQGVLVSDGALSTAVHGIRSALGESERSRDERWIETIRGRGYRYRGPVERVGGDPSAEDVEFVGRSDALGALQDRARRAAMGAGRLALVRGPAGIGKSRLARELARHVDGMRVVTVQCEEGEPPFWPWRELLRRLSRAETATVGLDLPDSPPGGSRERFRQTRDLLGQLRRLARDTPLLIVIEDLHWCDRASLALLEALVPGLGETRALILGTQRTGQGEPAAFGGLLASPLVDVHELGGLSFSDLWYLIHTATGQIPKPDEVSRLATRSGGVPLFAVELVRLQDPQRIAETGRLSTLR